jgi:hypothetical protein
MPKTPSIPPIDMGSQNLKLMSMLRKRLSMPRSRMRRIPHTETSRRAAEIVGDGRDEVGAWSVDGKAP